jgi:hypothetical protein
MVESQSAPSVGTEHTMKYALLIYGDPELRESGPAAPPGIVESWIDYTVALKQSGALLGAEQLRPTETATSVTVRADGERLLTDGPFAETKEHLLGFYLLDVEDLDTALDWAARMPVLAYGTVEVRPVVEGAHWQEILK